MFWSREKTKIKKRSGEGWYPPLFFLSLGMEGNKKFIIIDFDDSNDISLIEYAEGASLREVFEKATDNEVDFDYNLADGTIRLGHKCLDWLCGIAYGRTVIAELD
jgi:hypothetical protein